MKNTIEGFKSWVRRLLVSCNSFWILMKGWKISAWTFCSEIPMFRCCSLFSMCMCSPLFFPLNVFFYVWMRKYWCINHFHMLCFYLVSDIHFQTDKFIHNSSKLDALCYFECFLFHLSIFMIWSLATVGCLASGIKSFLSSSKNLNLIFFMTPCPIDILLRTTNHFILLILIKPRHCTNWRKNNNIDPSQDWQKASFQS